VKDWKDKGVIYAFNSRTKQNMPLYYQLYETTQANKERLNIVKRAKEIHVPSLIFHGTNDEAVPFNDAKELHRAISGSSLMLLEGAGHTFEAKHPYTEASFTSNANKVIGLTMDFLNS
jgi:pimeloyl-ACP methyl ester carboxylesterase